MNKLSLFILSFLLTGNIFAQHAELEKNIQSVIQGKKATVGVAVIFDDNTTLTINDDYRYPTMSVYKFHQALAVLDYLNKKNLPLETEILVSKSDLLPDTHSPLRDEHPRGNFNMSIADLLTYSVSKSDNNACDILFKYLGGTAIVDTYINSLGVSDFSINATEAMMHEKIDNDYPNQYLNWTSPSASTLLMEIFLRKDLFADTYKQFLKTTLIGTSTGKDKLKALLPDNVTVGHKTGSSFRNNFGIQVAENDLGFIKLPNGKQYSIGIFIMNSREDDKTNSNIIAEISKAVYDYYSTK